MLKPKRFYGKGLPGAILEELKGQLIVVEGADGSGRSTQIELLKNWLERRGYPTANVGLKRSMLVSGELEAAMQGNILGTRTLSLFYATDFADQLENRIIPLYLYSDGSRHRPRRRTRMDTGCVQHCLGA
jgi:dTMP kinase